MPYKYTIGIDPDLTKSGYAVYDTEEKKLVACETLTFSGLQFKLKLMHRHPNTSCFVRLEAGWLIKKSNWRTAKMLGEKFSPITAARISEKQAKNVGENHAIGKLIEEFLKAEGIPYELVKPFGATSMFKDVPTFQRTTGWTRRTHNDGRSAAAICWEVRK